MATADDESEYARMRKASSDTLAGHIAACAHLVEATSFESLSIWERWKTRVEWVQLSPGYLAMVGRLAKMPVCVSVDFNRINGEVVGFYHATSQVVDHRMIEEWRAKEFPRVRSHTDAMNFHNCGAARWPDGVPVPADTPRGEKFARFAQRVGPLPSSGMVASAAPPPQWTPPPRAIGEALMALVQAARFARYEGRRLPSDVRAALDHLDALLPPPASTRAAEAT